MRFNLDRKNFRRSNAYIEASFCVLVLIPMCSSIPSYVLRAHQMTSCETRSEVALKSKKAPWTRFSMCFSASRWIACTASAIDILLKNLHRSGNVPTILYILWSAIRSIILGSMAGESDWPVRWAVSYITFAKLESLYLQTGLRQSTMHY